MSKTKTPFFSLGAHGSVGDVLSVRHSRGVDVLEKKPMPTDPQSLRQIYQRWDYSDYVAQWNDLSAADKRTWHSNATRYHMTGFAYWMRYYLKNLPDIAARFHLDERGGALAIDTSRNLNHGTVVGALRKPGRIDYALEFDGVNDLCSAPHNDAYNLTTDFSMQAWVYPDTQTAIGLALKCIVGRENVFMLTINRVNHRLYFYWYPLGVPTSVASPAAIPLNAWTLITITFELLAGLKMFWGTTRVLWSLFPSPTQAMVRPLCIGNVPVLNRPFKGIIDEVTLIDRVITTEDIARHNERSYPF